MSFLRSAYLPVLGALAPAITAVFLLSAGQAAQGDTERVSVDSDEAQATGGASTFASISADGRFVAFASNATNLVPDDTNLRSDVFVRDRLDGITERVSVDSDEAQADGNSSNAAISADGRFVAFNSDATNLVADDTDLQTDIFVRDRLNGTTERVSVDSDEAEADNISVNPAISADGRFVAFESDATNLVPGDTNARRDIFVRDRLDGTAERVNVNSDEAQAMAAHSFRPSISADGRFVAFDTFALLVPGDAAFSDIYVRDRLDGTTERVSVDSGRGRS